MLNEISFSVTMTETYEKAIEKVTEALKAEGFGVLTEIDVKATLKQKINADFRKYSILGACNPPLAHKTLQSDPLVGLLLPCNVTVEETDEGALVNLINPKAMLLSNPIMAENETVIQVAEDVFDRFSRIAETLAQPTD